MEEALTEEEGRECRERMSGLYNASLAQTEEERRRWSVPPCPFPAAVPCADGATVATAPFCCRLEEEGFERCSGAYTSTMH